MKNAQGQDVAVVLACSDAFWSNKTLKCAKNIMLRWDITVLYSFITNYSTE